MSDPADDSMEALGDFRMATREARELIQSTRFSDEERLTIFVALGKRLLLEMGVTRDFLPLGSPPSAVTLINALEWVEGRQTWDFGKYTRILEKLSG